MPVDKELWAADQPISQPMPPEKSVLVDFKGFGFTVSGICHNITEGEAEELFIPSLTPPGYRGWLDVGEDDDE